MTLHVYDKGDTVRLSTVFKNASLVATDPTAVTLKVTAPDGVTTLYTYGVDAALVKDSTGNYHLDVAASAVGEWHYQWEGTGPVLAVEPGVFMVKGSGF